MKTHQNSKKRIDNKTNEQIHHVVDEQQKKLQKVKKKKRQLRQLKQKKNAKKKSILPIKVICLNLFQRNFVSKLFIMSITYVSRTCFQIHRKNQNHYLCLK